MCRSKQKAKMGSAHCLTRDQGSGESADDNIEEIYDVHQKCTTPYTIKVALNDAPLEMEIDTGAAVSIISTYQKLGEVTLN